MYKSIKNIFLGIIFLCVFLVPVTSIKAENLYSGDRTVSELAPYQLSMLQERLEASNSKFNVREAKWNTNNVYRINTGQNNIFIYDPTPENTKNRDAVVLGTMVQEKDGTKDYMFVPEDPNMYKESKEAEGFFDRVDKAQGLEPGTTVKLKNERYNAELAKQEKQNEYDRLAEIAKQKEQEAATLQNDPNATQAQIDQAITAARTARQAADEAGRAVVQAGGQLAGIENQINQTQGWQASQTQCSTVLSMFTPHCMMWLVAQGTNIIFKLMSFITYIVGVLFDYSLELSINSAEFFKKLGVIEVTWTFLRDILNITFIFILLWAAIQILIGNEAQYNAKKVLMNVVVVAILINFSLFAAKIMVDGSNIVSLKIYETMKASSTQDATASISARVMNTVGLSALYNINQIFADSGLAGTNACANNPGALITISVLGSIFLVILCLALGLAAVLFLVRLVNIIVLFIKSPLWVWGYVLPNNPHVSKFKDSWWAEMKHVLTFPIAYLFWMLVAIIIFEKLGSGANGTSFLQIICQPPAAGTSGMSTETISVFAVFVIVIIFMMRAISYGVKHAAGTGETIGGKWSQSVANKFGSWQDAATKGLAKKTWEKSSSAAAGVGIGAAKLTAGTATGGLSKLRGKTFSEGFYNPSITVKEGMRDLARSIAANNPNNILGERAAKMATQLKDPKNSAGETRKQADERRDKGVKETRDAVYDAIDAKYKAMSQDEWMKKNKNKTTDDYENYLNKLIEDRSSALLGKGVVQINSGKKDDKGNALSHLDNIRRAAVIKSETTDDQGNKKITVRLNEHAMHTELENVVKYHTDGEGAQNGADITNDQKRALETFRRKNEKAKARITAISSKIKNSKSTTASTQRNEDRTKKYEKDIKTIESKLSKLPTEDKIKECISQDSKYVGDGDNTDEIKEINKNIIYLKSAKKRGNISPEAIKKLEDNLEESKNKYIEKLNKHEEELIEKKMKLSEHLQKIEDAKKENK